MSYLDMKCTTILEGKTIHVNSCTAPKESAQVHLL